jgi:hypothetical protein
MSTNFEEGKELGRKHLAKINAQSGRWKNRCIPAYIREHLLVPYYLTEEGGVTTLYVIQYPLDGGRVSFLPLIRGDIITPPT